jgi:hypothetical protein
MPKIAGPKKLKRPLALSDPPSAKTEKSVFFRYVFAER